MNDNASPPITNEKRSDTRTIVADYFSVQFQVDDTGPIYQFRLRDESTHGLSILVREDSSILERIKINDVLEMDYFADAPSRPMKTIKTKIVHMTRQDSGRFKGHFLVGLATLPQA
jgi:hypothetical protein